MDNQLQTRQAQALQTGHSATSIVSLLRSRSQIRRTDNAMPEVVAEFLRCHPSISEYTDMYPISAQMTLCSPDISIGAVADMTRDECPTLKVFRMAYGNPDPSKDRALRWMAGQLQALNKIAAVQTPLNAEQILTLAEDIYQQYPYLNLAEICLFLGRVRRGHYGTMYNRIDNVAIMQWMRAFMQERMKDISKYEDDRLAAEREQEREARKENMISHSQYLENLRRDRGKSPEAEQAYQNALKTAEMLNLAGLTP